MSAQENVQIVKDAYAAFGRRDIPALLALLSEDVDWRSPGTGLPLSGTYRGREGVATFFQKLSQEAEITAFEPREFVAEGDRVFVVGWESVTVKATNRSVELDWVMAFSVRNGKIATFSEYIDTQAMADAYQAASRAAG